MYDNAEASINENWNSCESILPSGASNSSLTSRAQQIQDSSKHGRSLYDLVLTITRALLTNRTVKSTWRFCPKKEVPCPIEGIMVLIPIYSDCYSGLQWQLDLPSLPEQSYSILMLFLYILYDLSIQTPCYFCVCMLRVIYKFLNVRLFITLLLLWFGLIYMLTTLIL